MKKILVCIVLCLFHFHLFAQDKIRAIVQEKAVPYEGIELFYKNFMDKFEMKSFPASEKEVIIVLMFVVEKDGTFSDIRSKSDYHNLGREAVKTLKKMPAWKPAKHEGKIVRQGFTMPIIISNPNKKER